MQKKFTTAKLKMYLKQYINVKKKIKKLILAKDKYKMCSTFYDKDSSHETTIIYTEVWIIYKDSYNKAYKAINPFSLEVVVFNAALEVENIHLSNFIKWSYSKYKGFIVTMFDPEFRGILEKIEKSGFVEISLDDINQITNVHL